MFNERMFRSRAVLEGLTLAQVADLLGIHETTLHGKLKRNGAFTRDEINKLSEILGLTDEDVISIFFAHELT